MRTARQILVCHLSKSNRFSQAKRSVTGTTGSSKTPITPTLTITPEDARKINSAEESRFQQTILPFTLDNLTALTSRTSVVKECLQPCIAIRRKLFTPGPLMVSDRVKSAMLTDIAKRHADFAYLVKFVRNALLQIARVDPDVYTSILTNGSGTAAAEGTIKSVLGKSRKKLLILENGHYALRLAEIARISGIGVKVIPLNMSALQDALLKSNDDIGAVMAVHCETSSGLVNPVDEIGDIVKKCSPDCLYIVDGVTSFGVIPIKMKNVDFLISNACKSLQGVPGVAFVIAKREQLEKHRSQARFNHGAVLDIVSQHDELERSGMFRYTPPTHVMLAFKECLLEYSDEGGLIGRSARSNIAHHGRRRQGAGEEIRASGVGNAQCYRWQSSGLSTYNSYKKNSKVLKEEMIKMGFKQLYSDEENPNGYLVTSFLYPNIPQFVFDEFCRRLSDAGHVICSDKSITVRNCFRIGTVGDIREDDIRALTNSIRDVCGDMRISLPLATPVY